MYNTPTSRNGGAVTGKKSLVPDGPVAAFTTLIVETPPEQWQKRVAALRALVDSIPDTTRPLDNHGKKSHPAAWFNTPALLRHLALPMGDLLKDARSTVVKRTCESLTRLFLKCQSDARYLFKDVMPVILSVHAQTVQVIRAAVQEMVVDSIPAVWCKMVMPLWMERLKTDKSRTVRDACALYLGHALRSWNHHTHTNTHANNTNSTNTTTTAADGVNYLTDEIWIQVGGALVHSLRDPSPQVRAQVKSALQYMQHTQPHCWQRLLAGNDNDNDNDCYAIKDPKLLRWLQSLGQEGEEGGGGEAVEELSVASKFSYNSEARYYARPQPRASPSSNFNSNNRRGGLGINDDWTDHKFDDSMNVPMSIQVSTTSSSSSSPVVSRVGGKGSTSSLPPPQRIMNAPFQQIIEISPPPPSSLSLSSKTTTARSHSSSSTAAYGSRSLHSTSTSAPLLSHYSTTSSRTPPRHPVALDKPYHHQKSPLQQQQQQQQQHYLPTTMEDQNSTTASSDIFPTSLTSRILPTQSHPPCSTSTTTTSLSAEEVEGAGSDVVGLAIFQMDNIQELKKHAAHRRSRNSILMKQRLRLSADSTVRQNGTTLSTAPPPPQRQSQTPPPPTTTTTTTTGSSSASLQPSPPPTPTTPEHMVIAVRLLREHKAHVDEIMETLKIEMDALRDFDRVLCENEEKATSSSTHKGRGLLRLRPSEEEVLDYFESVGLCLDQRIQAGLHLQREMDRISRGD